MIREIRKIKYRFRYFLKGIKNLYRWFPVIWRDRDWDHVYFYIILEKKLTHMAEYFEKRGITNSSGEDAKLMRNCVKLIQDLQKDFMLSHVEEEFLQEKKRVLFDTIKENIDTWWD
jgi:hypothetical protein